MISSLPEALARLDELAAEFAGVLDNETAALRARNARELAGIVTRKSALLQEIESATAHLLATLGISATEVARLRPLLDSAGQGEAWARISGRLAACLKTNRDNGLMIEAGRNLNRNLLDILRGPATVGTYSADGRLGAGAGYNNIAEA